MAPVLAGASASQATLQVLTHAGSVSGTQYWQMPTTTIPHRRMVRVASGGWRTATMALAVVPNQRSSVMKPIISALVALSVLTGVAASANAFDAKSFYEELERSRT